MVTNWKLSVTYFETCNCEVGCPCAFLSPPTHKKCDAIVAFHINHGKFGDRELDGLNVVMVVQSPETNRLMWDGNVKLALYVDNKADETQRDAITKIFSGQVGGLFAELANAVTQYLGTKSVQIDFKREDGKFSLAVPRLIAASIEPLKGQGDKVVELHNSPLVGTVNVGKSNENKFTDQGVSWTYSSTNGFYADFELTGP